MKQIIALLFFFLSITSQAFEYDCMAISYNPPMGSEQIKMLVSGDEVQMSFQGYRGVEVYGVLFDRPVDQFGRERMSLLLESSSSDFGQPAIDVFYADKELLSGGYRLHSERMGGFMRTLSADGSWKKYICEM